MLAARSSNSGGLWHWVAEGYPSIHWFSTDDIPIISLSYPHHPPCGKNNGVCDTPDLSGVTWSTPSTPSEMWWWFFFRPFGPGWNLAQFFFLGWITARWLQRKSLSWYYVVISYTSWGSYGFINQLIFGSLTYWLLNQDEEPSQGVF